MELSRSMYNYGTRCIPEYIKKPEYSYEYVLDYELGCYKNSTGDKWF